MAFPPGAGAPPPGEAVVPGAGGRRLLGWLITIALLAVALLGSVGLAVWAVGRPVGPAPPQGTEAMPAYAEDALADATAAAERLFSYDYRTFDSDVKRGLEVTTGSFSDDYRKTTDGIRETVRRERTVVRAEVSDSGVAKAGPRRVEVLLFVNQYRRSATISGEKVDENRVVLVMVPVAEQGWLVAAAEAL